MSRKAECRILNRTKKVLLGVLCAGITSGAAYARDNVIMVGSSTVFPFAARVSEHFASKFGHATVLDSTGTGGGFNRFCAGIGGNHPDVTGASRRIKQSEYDDCLNHGVNAITEVKFGKDGIVVASSVKADPVAFTREHFYLALAGEIPQQGKFVPNPHKNWSDIDANLPATPIEVLGPPDTSGTRDAFQTLAIEAVCKALPETKALTKERQKQVCGTLRTDGAFRIMGEDDTLIVKELRTNPNAFGIFGFSYAYNNAGEVQANTIDGIQPDFDTIADDSYPLARPLYIYVKNQHLSETSGLKDFVHEFISTDAVGDEGYLVDLGLIPLLENEMIFVRGAAQVFTPMTPIN